MRPLFFIAVFLLSVVLVSTCACQLFQPALENIKVGNQVNDKTKEVISPVATFPASTEVIYASVYLKNAFSDVKLRATWSWEGHDLSAPTELDASGSRFAAFSVQRPVNGWKSGNYTVTIEMPDTDQRLSTNFRIE